MSLPRRMLHSDNFSEVIGAPIGRVWDRESGSFKRAVTSYQGTTPDRDTVPPAPVEPRHILPDEGHRDDAGDIGRARLLARYGIDAHTPASYVRVIVHTTLRGVTERLNFELQARIAGDDREHLLIAAFRALRWHEGEGS